MGAVKKEHRGFLEDSIKADFSDSVDIDEAFRPGHEQEHRWDYLLGHRTAKVVIGLEPHSAKQGEVSTLIAKRTAAQDHLRSHLKSGAKITAWLWVASGAVHFADTEKTRRQLDQHGILFVGTKVLRRHLSFRSTG
ncbi:MAG: hypothetical protein HY903_19830 [Deltaproteobacteria bacterium]|nr:hypothetical protein [Deltaproteobacteria bacterium]